MEKISIVEKRKRHFREQAGAASSILTSGDTLQKTSETVLHNKSEIDDHWKGQRIELPDTSLPLGKEDVVSLKLTPEQSSFLLSNKLIDYLSADASHDIFVSTKSTDDRSIIFNFHLNISDSLRLLKMDQVCEILQVSSRFLSNLVKRKKIRSYKIGGLRRFSLNDILTFLAESEDNQKSI